MLSTSTPESLATPDWQTLGRDVVCPLCDYNLRGLTEPRCPECGYAFRWPELLDANVGLHPYLFEHYPKRPVRAFVRTLRGNLRPRRFWRSITPTQPISVRRLLGYWAIVATIILFGGAALRTAGSVSRQVRQDRDIRARWLASYGSPRDPSKVMFQPGVTMQQVLDTQFPSIPHPRFWRAVWRSDSMFMTFIVAAALWPFLTLATLLIFIASIQRARIKWAHVLRCSVYGSDAFIAISPVAPLLFTATWFGGEMHWFDEMRTVAWAFLALALVAAYRLIVAFHIYLRFRHAAATVLASQSIVLLALVVVLFQHRDAYALFLRF